eukprot:scaffold5479_cov199-Amphora_coffeaeformis.AAC.11
MLARKVTWIGFAVWILSTWNISSWWSTTKQFRGSVATGINQSKDQASKVSSMSHVDSHGNTDTARRIDSTAEWNSTEQIVDLLLAQEAPRSAAHTERLLHKQHVLQQLTSKRIYRYMAQAKLAPLGVQVTDTFAYLHIWKSGGSTVASQTGNDQHTESALERSPHWFTFVRDPVDHF